MFGAIASGSEEVDAVRGVSRDQDRAESLRLGHEDPVERVLIFVKHRAERRREPSPARGGASTMVRWRRRVRRVKT